MKTRLGTFGQRLLQRENLPGDRVFAALFFLIAVILLSQIDSQTIWKNGRPLTSQPMFWPTISLGMMVFFGGLHLTSTYISSRIYSGELQAVRKWLVTVEYALWLIAYAFLVPFLGYLPSTLIFSCLLAFRIGYRSKRELAAMAGCALTIVLIFRTFLQVKLPGGKLYEFLPNWLAKFMLTYL